LLLLCFCQHGADLNTNGAKMSLLSRTLTTALTTAFVDTAELFTAGRKYKADVDSATASKRDEHAAIATIELKRWRALAPYPHRRALGRKPLSWTGYTLSRLPRRDTAHRRDRISQAGRL
jgi:hypothetical protein